MRVDLCHAICCRNRFLIGGGAECRTLACPSCTGIFASIAGLLPSMVRSCSSAQRFGWPMMGTIVKCGTLPRGNGHGMSRTIICRGSSKNCKGALKYLLEMPSSLLQIRMYTEAPESILMTATNCFKLHWRRDVRGALYSQRAAYGNGSKWCGDFYQQLRFTP